MRHEACGEIERREEVLRPFFQSGEKYGTYVSKMRDPHEFGDGHCNRALVDRFQQPLLVFRKGTDQPPTVFLPREFTDKLPMLVQLDETRGRGAEHFDTLDRPVSCVMNF